MVTVATLFRVDGIGSDNRFRWPILVGHEGVRMLQLPDINGILLLMGGHDLLLKR